MVFEAVGFEIDDAVGWKTGNKTAADCCPLSCLIESRVMTESVGIFSCIWSKPKM